MTTPLVDSIVPDFDPFAAGETVAVQTSIFEIHIGTPGFRKAVNSEQFMATLATLNEEQIAALSPEAKEMIALFRHQNPSGNNQPDDNKKLEASMFSVNQALIDKKSIAAIAKLDKQYTNWIKAHTVPSPVKFQGAYLMRVSEATMIDLRTRQYEKNREELVNAMGQRWNAIVEDAKTKLGPFFNSSDYPPFAQIKPKYDIEFRWLNFNVPAALEQLDKEIYDRESKKARIFFANAAQEARDAARIAFQGLTNHLLDQLGYDEQGKAKRFMGSSVEKVLEFIEMFIGGGDLTADGQLQELAKRCKDILQNVDPDEVRKEQTIRTSLETAMKAISEEASKMVVVGQRMFALEDEEPEHSGSSTALVLE